MCETKSPRDELINKIADLKGSNEVCKEYLPAGVQDSITAMLKEDKKVPLVGWGTFEVQERKATTGRNPRTGEIINIHASKRVVFKVREQAEGSRERVRACLKSSQCIKRWFGTLHEKGR